MPIPFTLIAYRGGSREAPENTCEAIQCAARVRVPSGLRLALEVDLRMTRDGQLVAMHDESVERTTTGRGKVEQLSLGDLRRFDAAGSSTLRGVRVPTLAELLEVTPQLPIVLDVHGAQATLPDALVACLARQNRSCFERVIVASELTRVVLAVRKRLPELRTAATPREVRAKVLLERARLDAFAPRGRVWMVPEQHGALHVLTPRFARMARASGDEVWPWLADSRGAARRFERLGATGAFTPCPGEIAAQWQANEA